MCCEAPPIPDDKSLNFFHFLAVQDSSIGDIVSQSDRLLISASPEHYRAVVDNVRDFERLLRDF